MLKHLPAALVGLALVVPHIGHAEPEGKNSTTSTEETESVKPATERWESEKRQAALQLQLFLDKEGFGPGKIDAHWGGFTKKAAERWNESGNEPKILITADGDLDLANAKTLPKSGDMTTTYTITDQDGKMLGTLPDEPEEMAKLKELPYTSLMELVAEKFHADPDFITAINGLKSEETLEVGDKVKVPNVSEPFDISEPMGLASGDAEGDEESESKEQKPEKSATGKAKELTVLREQRVVELREDGKLVNSFPISPGANDNESPEGEWKVSVVSWMPEFRWDKSMLEDGKRSDDAYLLAPGPNNPVGIVWIGISADGIGLHGTPFPDAIGRNRSHGCIRLSNWDALKLGKSVEPGTRVIIK